MRTDRELFEIAEDIRHGSIFTDRHLSPDDEFMVPSIFMPFTFMSQEQREGFLAMDPRLIFEHLDRAQQRTVNGFPVFMSYQFLNREELDKVVLYMDGMASYEEAVVSEGEDDEVDGRGRDVDATERRAG